MKPKKLLLLLTVVLVALVSCNQMEEVTSTTLDASKTSNIKKGEPVIFKFNNIPDGSVVVWKVTPEEGVDINANAGIASVLFSKAGNYNINATYANAVVKANVVVIDSVYNPTVNSLTPLINGETLNVTAIINDSSSVGKPDILLSLVFSTSNKYNCLNNFLLTRVDPFTGIISFDGVFTPDSRFCSAGEKTAQGVVTLNPDPNSKSNKLEIVLDGTPYKGYYYVSNKQLYVYWPYQSGITFNNAIMINNGNTDFDVNNPDVALFVSQLKAGTYNSYKKDEFGQNLWLEMPKFTAAHIPALLEFAKDTASIYQFPLNPISSRTPYPSDRNYFILGEGLLWIVEGIRVGATTASTAMGLPEFKFASLDPYLIKGSPFTLEVKKGLTKSEILQVRELYYNWWYGSYIPEWWLRTPPLEGTDYSWF